MNRENLRKLAFLCRLSFTEEELDEISIHLDRVLDHANQLEKIDTEGVAPCYCVLEDLQIRMRDDQVEKSFETKEFLRSAPDQIGGLVRVPPILAQEEE